MLKPIIIPHPPLTVRNPIVSGVIERKDGNTTLGQYGVIFTSGPDHAATDFDPAELLGAVIEHVTLPPEETDRYFTIVGGYYCEKIIDATGKKISRTNTIFGVAADKAKGFDIREDKSRELADDWQLTLGSKPPKWDEKRPNQPWTEERVRDAFTSDFNQAEFDVKHTYGWTFIVAETKLPENTPCDEQELGLRLKCPDITSLTADIQAETETYLDVLLTAIIQGPSPATFVWEWAPGDTETGQSPTIVHRFEKPLAGAETRVVRLDVSGPFSCEVSAEVSVKVPAQCPQATAIVIDQLDESPLALTYTLSASYTGPAPDLVTWDFGDGTTASGLTGIAHTYPRTPGQDTTYEIEVSLTGPGKCRSALTHKVVIPKVCPDLTGIEVVQTVLDETTITFELTAVSLYGTPDTFNWVIGGTPSPETTQVITHTFALPAGDPEEVLITVQGQGPGDCGLTALQEVAVTLPGVCPVLHSITAEPGDIQDGQLSVTFTAHYFGPAPDHTIWAYAETEVQTTTPVWTLVFDLPVGDPGLALIAATGWGPESCVTEEKTIQVVLPALCPLLTDLEVITGELTDTTQTYSFTALYDGPAPANIVWTLGTETLASGQPQLTHTFERPAGDAAEMSVTVTLNGPGACGPQSRTVTLTIPGVCPVLTALTTESAGILDTQVDFVFKATYTGPAPLLFSWTVGTQVIETTNPSLSWSVPRPLGDSTDLLVTVQASGPGSCSTDTLNLTVAVAGICPEITVVTAVALPEESLSQVFQCTVTTAKTTPTGYVWNWGDDTAPETTTLPQAEHRYDRKPGDPVSQTITVTTSGPGACAAMGEVIVTVPGLCPEVAAFSLVPGALDDTHQQILATLTLAKAEGTAYHWNWGDGTPPETTTTPSTPHAYQRLPGDPKGYAVSVRIEGPGACVTLASGQVTIPGICPVIISLTPVLSPVGDTQTLLTVTALVAQTPAQQYEWSWGDGTPVTTTLQPTAQHTYQRLPGDPIAYLVGLRAIGPDACQSSSEISVSIPGICPEIVSVSQRTIQLTEETQEQEFTLDVARTPATGFRWDWGDGSPATDTTGPVANHLFNRTPGVDTDYLVKVQAIGPGSCASQVAAQVRIPKRCPVVTLIDIQYAPPVGTAQSVTVQLALSLEPVTSLVWEWGDGMTETTTSLQATHIFQRLPGDERLYPARVHITGPGTCECSVALQIRVPGICPQVLSLDVVTETAADYLTQPVRATVAVDYPAGVTYLWNWSDGTPAETTLTPTATHVYARHPGDPRTYTLVVTVQGPEGCVCTAASPLTVPGYCPQVVRHDLATGTVTDDTQEALISLTLDQGQSDQILWTWGDGSEPVIMPGTVLTATHLYKRLPGDTRIYPVTITLQGPGTACDIDYTLQVPISGICPVISQVQVERTESVTETTQTVFVSAEVLKTPATAYRWSWGDGSPDTVTTVPDSSHTYTRLPGDPVTYVIGVQAEGPGACASSATVSHPVPGLCPRLEEISLYQETPEAETQLVSATLVLALATGERYTWDWGDGSDPEATTEPHQAHLYPRLPGDDQPYTVHVTIEGPGSCVVTGTRIVTIPGRCPEISGLVLIVTETTPDTLVVQATVQAGEIMPLAFTWHWGDGTPAESGDSPVQAHTYRRLPGDTRTYPVRVDTQGPGTTGQCDRSATSSADVPGFCPELVAVEITTHPLPDETTQTVQVHAIVERTPADAYHWNWGDGSPEEITTEPNATHIYPRLAGASRILDITLTLSGPGRCTAALTRQVEIQGSCPKITDRTLTRLVETAESLEIKIALMIEDQELIPPGVVQYHWHWGDGSTETTHEPVATHTFIRAASDQILIVEYELSGAGTCQRAGCVRVLVEGYCPVIADLAASFCDVQPAWADLKFTVQFRQHPQPAAWPDQFIWQWGDGSPDLITAVPYAGHRFVRYPDQVMTYPVRVIARGGPCGCETRYEQVLEVPGACPMITDIEVVYGDQTPDWQEVTLIPVIRGGVPGRYEWIPGDGQPTVTSAHAWFTHRYPRTQERYQATLRITGQAGMYSQGACEHVRHQVIGIALALVVG
ncbi:MAG: PKD domain-containing protein [Bacteroidia bacterium]|nr:PKD domain-containing protein [Bacteroidia bacterium]